MEGMRKSNVELIIDKYEKLGKVKTVSVEESTEIFDAIDGRMRKHTDPSYAPFYS